MDDDSCEENLRLLPAAQRGHRLGEGYPIQLPMRESLLATFFDTPVIVEQFEVNVRQMPFQDLFQS
ncbi:hypothetical protein D3C86_2205690 [compost metagenome]